MNTATKVAVTKTVESVAPDTTAPKETAARSPVLAKVAEEIKTELGERWIPRLYRERILQMRTRAHHLQAQTKKMSVEIQHTLLGVELKIGRHRLMCPDLATARYLAVFARAGSRDVAVPYDISRISSLADELESSWHRMLLLVENAAEKRTAAFRSRLRNLLVQDVRREIMEAGAGAAIPQFNQNTKQRRT